MGLTSNWVKLAEFRRALAWTTEYLSSESGAAVVIVGLTPWSDLLESYAPKSGPLVARYEASGREVAAACGAAFVPFALFLQEADASGPRDIAPDGTHFNVAGHRAVASVLSRVVRAAVPSTASGQVPAARTML